MLKPRFPQLVVLHCKNPCCFTVTTDCVPQKQTRVYRRTLSIFYLIYSILGVVCFRNIYNKHDIITVIRASSIRIRGSFWAGPQHGLNERRNYIVTPPVVDWVHTQDDPCVSLGQFHWWVNLSLAYLRKGPSRMEKVTSGTNCQSGIGLKFEI